MPRIWNACVTACLALTATVWGCSVQSAFAEDWPMLGRDGTRNGVSPERGAPTVWSVEAREEGRLIRETRGVRWAAQLGSQTFSSPIVSSGLVWIGTFQAPSGEKNPNHCVGMLKCFRVADGQQVYEFLSPPLAHRHQGSDWHGLGSSPLIEGDRLWIATNRGEVHCLDIGPLIRGDGPPRELWKLDLIKTFEPFQRVPIMGPPRPCSIGASWKGRIFVTINNGISEDHMSVPKPDAPSLVCLDKDTGEVHWQDNSPDANILVTQFSSPTVAEIAGQMQVIVPQSDGWVRAFDPESGGKLWEFDINPKASVYMLSGRSNRNSLLGNAVVYEGRVYIASGLDPDQGEGVGRLVCIDPTKRGDVSSELAVDAHDKPLSRRRTQAVDPKAGEKAISNPNSALIWEFMSCGKKFEEVMHRSMSSVAVAKGLVIAADAAGLVHCFDAKTGQRHWSHDTFAAVWASPLIVDDKVYVGDEDGDVSVFGLSSDPNVAMKPEANAHAPLAEINMGNSVYTSPCFANGTLYVANRNMLFAITGDKEAESKAAVGGHWPQWRGPNRDNTSPETGLLKEWAEAGPPLVWRVDGLGEGIASVSIADGRIYTLGYFEDGEFLTALDQSTAQRVWATRLGPKVNENPLMRWLSQRSPTLDDDRVYAITSGGRLVCLSTRNGEELWSKNYPADFAAKRPTWGFCDYPLVGGDRLICTPGGPEASIVALDKRTGREIWRSVVPDGGLAAYAAIVATEVGGVRQYVAFLGKALVGVRASDGRPLWRYEKKTNGVANSHTPNVRGDQIVTSNGYGTGMALLKLVPKGEEFEIQEQYANNLSPDAFQDNGVIVGEHFFMSMNWSALFCLDWKTGERVWAERTGGGGKMAITSAEDRLYLRTSDGLVILADASSTAYVERGRFTIPDAVKGVGATYPIIAGGRLYLRDDNKLLCYDLRADSLKQPQPEPLRIVLAPPAGGPLLEPRERILRSVFVPTPQDIVEKMLELAAVKKTDVVYDLGSGDGRIVITAARKYGCKAVGYELDKELVESSRTKADAAGMKSLVTFECKDLFTADLHDADVIAVFLLPQQLEKLLPQLEKMKPGSRFVSHQFEIPGFPADQVVKAESSGDGDQHTVYLWTLPLKKENK